MVDRIYDQKEETRQALTQAIIEYKEAAEAYGHDLDDMANEIEVELFEAGLEELNVIVDR